MDSFLHIKIEVYCVCGNMGYYVISEEEFLRFKLDRTLQLLLALDRMQVVRKDGKYYCPSCEPKLEIVK